MLSSPRSCVTAALVAAALLALPTAAASAAFPGQNGRIAFARADATFSSTSIWTMNPDGTDQRQLTTAPGFNGSPAFSPDGRRIVFDSSRDGGNFEIYVMNADGTDQVRLTNDPATDLRPNWSPDGSMITFDSDRVAAPSFHREVFVMNADGSGQRSVTPGGTDDLSPAWFPNGGRIVFHTNPPGQPTQLADVRTDGMDRRPITTASAVNLQYPAFMPDGSRIAIWGPPPASGTAAEIYTIRPDGSDLKRLTTNNTIDDSPAYSPDGTKMVFTSNQTGSSELFVMNATGGDERPLTTTALEELDPDWGPAIPLPPPGAVDADGDGSPAGTDCDDGNAAVLPGAREVPGNQVDENCDRVLGQFGRVTAPVSNQWAFARRYTQVVRLLVRQVPADAKVRVTCAGKGCPFKSKSPKVKRGQVKLHKLFGKRKLKPGATITIRITQPDAIGKVVRYKIRRGKPPKSSVLCLPPGARKPGRC